MTKLFSWWRRMPLIFSSALPVLGSCSMFNEPSLNGVMCVSFLTVVFSACCRTSQSIPRSSSNQTRNISVLTGWSTSCEVKPAAWKQTGKTNWWHAGKGISFCLWCSAAPRGVSSSLILLLFCLNNSLWNLFVKISSMVSHLFEMTAFLVAVT